MGVPSPDAIEVLLDIGLAALLIAGGYFEWYVWGPAHRRRLAEKDQEARFWRDMALRGTSLAETAVDAAISDRLGDYRRADRALRRPDEPAR